MVVCFLILVFIIDKNFEAKRVIPVMSHSEAVMHYQKSVTTHTVWVKKLVSFSIRSPSAWIHSKVNIRSIDRPPVCEFFSTVNFFCQITNLVVHLTAHFKLSKSRLNIQFCELFVLIDKSVYHIIDFRFFLPLRLLSIGHWTWARTKDGKFTFKELGRIVLLTIIIVWATAIIIVFFITRAEIF